MQPVLEKVKTLENSYFLKKDPFEIRSPGIVESFHENKEVIKVVVLRKVKYSRVI